MATLAFTLDGTDYSVSTGSLSAIDAKEFRAKVGVALTQVFNAGSVDIDVLAGLVWLVRRKGEPGLTYEQVARSITYDSEFELASEPPPAAEIDSPEI